MQQDAVKARLVELLPDFYEVAVGALHEAVLHFHHVKPRAQGAVDGAHFEADDAAADDEHAFGHAFERQCAGGVHHAGVVGHEGQVHGLAAGGDDAALEAHGFCAASGLLAAAAGFLHVQGVGVCKRADAAHEGDFAHFGHGGQAAGEFGDDFFLVGAQLVQIDLGRAEAHASGFEMACFVDDGGHVQQGFGGDAAYVQAYAAQGGVALDKNDGQAQIGRAEGSAVAAGACAEHEHVAFDVSGQAAGRGHGSGRCSRGGGSLGRRGGGGRGRRRRSRGSGRGGGLTGFQREQHGAFADFVAQLHAHFFHHAGVAGGDFHAGLVGFDRDQRLLLAHGVAGLDEHFDDGDVFEVANVGNLDFNGGHGESPVLRRDEKGRKAGPCGWRRLPQQRATEPEGRAARAGARQPGAA